MITIEKELKIIGRIDNVTVLAGDDYSVSTHLSDAIKGQLDNAQHGDYVILKLKVSENTRNVKDMTVREVISERK